MPELPEVETVRRDVDRVVVGRTVNGVTLGRLRTLRRYPNPELFREQLLHSTFTSTSRHGKYLILHFSPEGESTEESGRSRLVVHLRMSGQLLHSPLTDPVPKHAHVRLELGDGTELRFVDPRTFGEMFVVQTDENGRIPELAHLGPDALDRIVSGALLQQAAKGRAVGLKPFLLDQSVVAGVGSIYADEICYRSKLRPAHSVAEISKAQFSTIQKSVESILTEAIEKRGSTLGDGQYVGVDGRPGSYASYHRVHAKAGLPCSKCGALVERGVVGQRSAYWCPKCPEVTGREAPKGQLAADDPLYTELSTGFAVQGFSAAVFLKTLTLKGFKSFAESTTLDLEPGITVVVGPNGSGKSNIVDAVAWVLGAQGAKQMRSNKMEDVIFAGTSKKAALGRAEVALTIDNSSGTLPIEFSEVTITRTLFRSGESEYAINNVPCRLLDVQDLLSDSGVGRQQHVIVSQGQLAAILDSRPEDRRAVIEEAAGILKFRKRRERAQRRLESTEANFVRLGDLLKEIRRQIRPLERQADAARKHDSMAAELAALRLHVTGRELAGLRVRAETHHRVQTDLAARERLLRTELARLDAEVLLAESKLATAGGYGQQTADLPDDPYGGLDLGDVLARAESLYEKARGQLAFLGERRRSVERDRNAFVDSGVVESLSAEAAKIAGDLDRVEDEANLLPPEFEILIKMESELESEREAFLTQWGADNNAAVGGSDGQATPNRTSGQVSSERRSAQQSLERTRSDHYRAETRSKQLTERIERLVADRDRVTAEIAELSALVGEDSEGAVSPLTVAREQAEAADSLAEAKIRTLEDSYRGAEGERRAWQARVDALSSALDDARARAGAQRLAALEGVVGTLLDLVEVDDGWEAAFEAAIGEAMSAVVVENSDVAKKALALLESSSVSGAVLALGAAKFAVSPQGLMLGDLPSGAESMAAHVRSGDQRVMTALAALLENAFCVAGTWTDALDAAMSNSHCVFVTRNGDRFSAHGWRAGVGSAGATGAALAQAQAAAETATLAASTCSDALKAARAELELARSSLKETRKAEQAALNEYQQRLNRLNTSKTALARFVSDHSEASDEVGNLERQIMELAARIEGDVTLIAALDAELPVLLESEAETAQRQNARREASQKLDQRAGAAAALRRALEVRTAGIEERRRILTKRSDEIDERLSRSVTERTHAEQRRLELDLLMERTEALHAVVMLHAERLEYGIADIRQRRKQQNDAARSATFALDGLRKGRATNEAELRNLLDRAQKIEIEATELRLRIETLVEQIRREFDVEPERAIDAPCPTLLDGTAPTTRIRDLERELRLMGAINPLAMEEFSALQERNKLIESELDDVKAARRDLAKVIKAIDEEIVTVFAAAFADVAENFKRLFEMLFPGGAGMIRLTDAEDPLNTGVEVDARPSGKNVRKLSLLSGGERSLTALAFLFAVFRSRPSPFYLMDEVEAALDDVNLHRFIMLLEEFRQEAQLLVVSHQKKTMEAADALYGVTMQPGGASKVVSERVAAHRS